MPRPRPTYRQGKISLAEARRRWDKTTKVGLAGTDRFDKQADIYKKAATTCNWAMAVEDRISQGPHHRMARLARPAGE